MEEAARYVALMEKNIRLNVHSKYLKRFYDISFEVYLRKKQYLAALRVCDNDFSTGTLSPNLRFSDYNFA